MTVKHPVAEANDESPFGALSPSEFYALHAVTHTSEFITNSRGMKLHTQWWEPFPPVTIVGIVAVVHGFTSESNWLLQLTAVLFAESGFAVCAIDHQGHGFSDDLVAHIPYIQPVVDDCDAFFRSFRARHHPELPAFLYTESLGGAIALLLTLRRDESGVGTSKSGRTECGSGESGSARSGSSGFEWDGLILNGEMCGISPMFKPPWLLEHLLWIASVVFPIWQMVPTRGGIPELSFKEEWKRRLALASPKRSRAKPRFVTARELLRVYREVQGRFEEVKMPFLIVHGGDDVVCDPACVEELYRRATSEDKTLTIYPGMWHQLVGECEEDVDAVFGQVVDWIRIRTERSTGRGGA